MSFGHAFPLKNEMGWQMQWRGRKIMEQGLKTMVLNFVSLIFYSFRLFIHLKNGVISSRWHFALIIL